MSDGSKPIKDARQEAFARNLAEQMTEDEAYTKAGYKADRSNASKLTAKHHIQARVAFLQGLAAERTVTTIEDITRQLDVDHALAVANKQASAAVSATMGKAKVLGLIINRHLVGMKRLEDMNEDELRFVLGKSKDESGGDGA